MIVVGMSDIVKVYKAYSRTSITNGYRHCRQFPRVIVQHSSN